MFEKFSRLCERYREPSLIILFLLTAAGFSVYEAMEDISREFAGYRLQYLDLSAIHEMHFH